ncbi:MAG: hypothetical protein ACFWTY_03865 [Shouchella clausii]|jgi:hypothetical protein
MILSAIFGVVILYIGVYGLMGKDRFILANMCFQIPKEKRKAYRQIISLYMIFNGLFILIIAAVHQVMSSSTLVVFILGALFISCLFWFALSKALSKKSFQ